jgi:hypothetical protein
LSVLEVSSHDRVRQVRGSDGAPSSPGLKTVLPQAELSGYSFETMFETMPAQRPCSFQGCEKPMLAKGYCSGHYKQLKKGKLLRPLRPFYGREGPYGIEGPCRFCDLPEVQSGEWEPCTAPRFRAGWCAGHAAQHYEKRPIAPLRKRRTGCDFPDCQKPHHCRGFCAGHYRQLQQGRPLMPLNLRKGWYKSGAGYVYIWAPDHPNADKRGYATEHTMVMAEALGRALLPWEEVHHLNGRRDDNRPENLELWARGRQPPGARVTDLLAEAWRTIHLYDSARLPKLPSTAVPSRQSSRSQAIPPLAREITKR